VPQTSILLIGVRVAGTATSPKPLISSACRHRDTSPLGVRRGPVRTGAAKPKGRAQTITGRLSRCGDGASPNEPGLKPLRGPGSFGSVGTEDA
jgi:hypothetical protein